MSSLRDRTNRIRPKSRVKALSSLFVLAFIIFPTSAPGANATGPSQTASMYLDQPFVQGSYVAEDYPSETSVTTFNDQNLYDVCSFNGGTIQPLYLSTPDCHVRPEINYGGASTTSSSPTVGTYPNPINYGAVGYGGASIVFDTPQTYFGMWWSAGSAGNQIQLLNGTDLVANTSANDVADVLYNAQNLNSQNGDAYATKFYISNPVDWQEVGTPTSFSDQDPTNTYAYQSNYTQAQEPFVYIHFIAAPGTTFNRVNLIAPGNGFEFDNFTTSSSTDISANIPSRLVLQRQIYAPTYVDFDANGGSGALPRQYSQDNSAGYLQNSCLSWYDPTHCIKVPFDSYSTWLTGWNTAPDGSGDAYDDGGSFPFSESKTLYAQWKSEFNFYNLTISDVDPYNFWDFVDYSSQMTTSVTNFADFTLPTAERPGQYLEGWYTYSNSQEMLVRAGSPGETFSASTYATWDSSLFARWVDNPPPPPSVDAITPIVIPVYPRSSAVSIPNLPVTGDTSAAICIAESDASGNEVSSNLQFTNLGTASNGFSSSYLVSAPSRLVSNSSRYLKVTVSPSSDNTCSTGITHVIELKPLGADLSKVLQVQLTVR